MLLFTLEQFLDQTGIPNVYLDEPEWSTLYVRKGGISGYWNTGESFHIDLAVHLPRFEAKVYGKGAFTRLIARIENHVPGVPIFIENLFNKSFTGKLPLLGFEEIFVAKNPYPGADRHFLKR